jgi:protein-tyrosine phosphatase
MAQTNSPNFLHIDYVQTPLGGQIGLTHCLGRCSLDAAGKQWSRDLTQDVATLKDLKVSVVVLHHGAGNIEALLNQAKIVWYQFPIADFGTPSPEVTTRWLKTVPHLLQHLKDGENILIHCAAGFGRTGMMSAALLVAMGVASEKAIRLVRASRPGTIETPGQEAFIQNLQTF